jgi:hypothetical protein
MRNAHSPPRKKDFVGWEAFDYRLLLAFDLRAHRLNAFIELVNSPLGLFQP